MTIQVKFEYERGNEEHKKMMGGYTFPILDELEGHYSVTIYRTPDNAEDLRTLVEMVREPGVMFPYVDGHKLVIIRADAKLSDLGLKVLTTENGSKTIKRAKTIARPFRIHSTWDCLRVMIVDGDKELDGAGIVSRDVYLESVENVQTGYWNPAQRAQIMRWLDRQPIHNCRFVGNLVHWETGENLNSFGKGNFIVGDTPVGVDIITTWDNLKHEVTGDGVAWALFEPQGKKDAWEDQQTFVNQRFLMSVPEARSRMKDNATQALDDLRNGRLMASTVELAKSDFYRDFAMDGEKFWAEMKWHANAWALHGLSYTLSPWLTERLGSAWISSLSLMDPRKIRIKIPCSVRAQVVSQALANLAGVDMEVPEGALRWCAKLNVAVANDIDWVNTIIPTHGGCDLDDFFVIRYRQIEGERKIILTRSPNARGEYSVWDFIEGDWFPKHVNSKGEEESFPPITQKRWPKQILKALADGDLVYKDLPSATNPAPKGDLRHYIRKDVLKDLESVMSITGGYGQYELAVRAENALSPTKMNPLQIRSEDAVDAFTQGGTVEDRQFILDDRKRIIRGLLAVGKPIDIAIGSRLGVRELQLTHDGPVSNIKRVMEAEVESYSSKMMEFCRSLPMPEFLEAVGHNDLSPYATQVLKASRQAMFYADQAYREAPHEDRVVAIREAQESMIMPFFEKVEDRASRAQYCLAFWRACRTMPTSGGNITDQPCFGTAMFPYLMDGLVFYGIAAKPYVDDRGRLRRVRHVSFIEKDSWSGTCKSCETTFQLAWTGLVRFWKNNQTCKSCRTSSEVNAERELTLSA